MGGGRDFDQLNAATEDSHRGKDDDAGFDDFSVTNKVKPHSQQVKSEQNKEPTSDLSGLEHDNGFPVTLRNDLFRTFEQWNLY